jgi:hypothetical protein
MYPSGLVDRINPYDPRFRTTGTSSADWVTRPQLTKPISISRYQFIKEYHIRKFQHPIGRQHTSHYIAIAKQALQLTKTKAFMGAHPQQEHDHSTENKATIQTTSQTEKHNVDNANLSASNQDQDNFDTTTMPCKRTLNEDEAEQYISGHIKRMRRNVDVLGPSDLHINNGDLIIMEASQAGPTSTNQHTSESQSTPTETKSGQNIYLNDIKAMRERIEWLKRNQRLQKYFEKQSTPTRTESRKRIENLLDNLSAPLEAATEWGIEEAIREATVAPIETQEIVHTIAQGLFSDHRAEENYDHQGDDNDQEDIDIIRSYIGFSEACSQDENNSQDEDNDQQSDNNHGHDDDNSQEDGKSQEDDGGKEGGNSEEDDNGSDLDDDEQDTESTNSEETDDAINEEDDILEDSDLDVDEGDLEPMNLEDIEAAINEMGGYAVVHQADHQEHAQNEPQQRIRVPLGEITQHELQQRDNRQQAPEEVQPEDPNANAGHTQRVRIFLRHNMFRSEEEPANEEDEEMQDTMRDFQIQQLVEEAGPEPQPLRRSERIRR